MNDFINISAIMPVRNGERWIDNSVTGILANLNSDDEVIIINDGSTDGTAKKLQRFTLEDPRIRVLDNNASGLVNALNLGLKEARFEWIARFDVDDTYSNDRLSSQRSMISSEIGAIFCDYKFVSKNGPSLGTIPSAIYKDPVALSLVSSQRTPHPGVLFNRELAISVGGYRQSDFPVEDLSLWLRISKDSHIISSPKTLLYYNLHQESVSLTNRENMIKKRDSLIRSIGVNMNSALRVSENFRYFDKLYRDQEFGEERTLLLLRDLILFKSTFDSSYPSKTKIAILSANLVIQKKYIESFLKLKVEQTNRGRIRSSNS